MCHVCAVKTDIFCEKTQPRQLCSGPDSHSLRACTWTHLGILRRAQTEIHKSEAHRQVCAVLIFSTLAIAVKTQVFSRPCLIVRRLSASKGKPRSFQVPVSKEIRVEPVTSSKVMNLLATTFHVSDSGCFRCCAPSARRRQAGAITQQARSVAHGNNHRNPMTSPIRTPCAERLRLQTTLRHVQALVVILTSSSEPWRLAAPCSDHPCRTHVGATPRII